MVRRCKTHGKRICIFCVVQSLAFPVEHLAWERAPGLAWVTVHILGI